MAKGMASWHQMLSLQRLSGRGRFRVFVGATLAAAVARLGLGEMAGVEVAGPANSIALPLQLELVLIP